MASTMTRIAHEAGVLGLSCLLSTNNSCIYTLGCLLQRVLICPFPMHVSHECCVLVASAINVSRQEPSASRRACSMIWPSQGLTWFLLCCLQHIPQRMSLLVWSTLHGMVMFCRQQPNAPSSCEGNPAAVGSGPGLSASCTQAEGPGRAGPAGQG